MSSHRERQGIAAVVLIAIMIGTAIAGAGCGSKANASSPVRLSEADNGRTISVKAGDSIQVILGGNPTTAYSWAASLSDADKAVLQQQGDAVYAQQSTDPSIVGAGGTFTFTFKAAAAGQVALKFDYSRPFESVQPIQTVSITVVVK